MDAKGLVADAREDLVEERDGRRGRVSGDVDVGDVALRVGERRELVKVRREQAEAAQPLRNVLRDGPRQTKAVVCRRPAPELVDDDERRWRRRLEKKTVNTASRNKGRFRTARMAAVSSISAMKVDTPRIWLSPAPTRARMASTTETSASSHGTNEPHCASSTITPICRMYVDLPPMLGPVMSCRSLVPVDPPQG